MGRRNKYETNVKPRLSEIPKMYETMTEVQIAKCLGVSSTSFDKYKLIYPELREALSVSKQNLAAELKSSLKKKAMGYYYEEEKVTQRKEGKKTFVVVEKYKKYAQPDTGAIHLLLKNIDEGWHNDDIRTLELKEKQVDIQQQKLDDTNWQGVV